MVIINYSLLYNKPRLKILFAAALATKINKGWSVGRKNMFYILFKY